MYFPFLNALGTGSHEHQIHFVLDLNIYGGFMKLIFMFNIMLIAVSVVMYAASGEGNFEHTLSKIFFYSKHLLGWFWVCFLCNYLGVTLHLSSALP